MSTDFTKQQQEWTELARIALDRAKEQGIELEVKFGSSSNLSVKVRKGKLEDLRRSAPFGVSMRAFAGQRAVSGASAHIDKESLLSLVDRLADNVELVDKDPANGLPQAELLYQGTTDLELYDPAVPEVTVDQAREMARKGEATAMAVDPRITNSSGATVGVQQALSAIFNSRGLKAFKPSTALSLSVSPVAEVDDEKYSEGWYSTSRFAADLASPEEVGRIAGERCVALIGADKIPTGKFPVLFAPDTAKDLVDLLFGCAAGDGVYKNATFLAGQEGKPIASPLVTIIDDPLRARGIASSPYDAEGVATKKRTLVDKGTLGFYPCDSFSARRLKRQSTGHSAGGGINSYNLYLANGETPAGELPGKLGTGLLVTAFIGFSFNKATGDFSRGVRGFWVEEGKTVRPVQEVTVSGNLGQMFQDVIAVGDDLQFRFGTDSPSLLLKEMTISGS